VKIAIAAIGLLKAGPEKLLAGDYETRIPVLGRKAGITGLVIQDWPESRQRDEKLRKAEEAERLWSIVPDGGAVVPLDERGDSLSSEAFAKFIAVQAEKGTRQLTFMIGGPDGHAPETRAKALKSVALGPMVWPHRLVRVMLLEQIYRSVTILVSHPYHRA
jgi:23S rRNA (pseudouridine1915-N3)-methyltransferase